MKNLHIISSNNPSRLVLDSINNNLFLTTTKSFPSDIMKFKNIYITSDEEIKEGDYYLDFTRDGIKVNHFKTKDDWVLVGICDSKKIILTTDQDLIKDGIQAIDDGFLEWFVENPGCEEIKIHTILHEHHFGFDKHKKTYKIIISKEETKPKTMFESLQEYLKNTPKEKVLEDWNEFQHLDNEGITVKEFLENQKQTDEKGRPLTYWGGLEEHKQETFLNEKCFKCGRNQYSSRKPFCTDDFCNKDFYQKTKQETLEEVAEKLVKNHPDFNIEGFSDYHNGRFNGILEGIKWQQEQNKKLYSEEDLREAFRQGEQNISYSETYGLDSELTEQQWFEQFKKK